MITTTTSNLPPQAYTRDTLVKAIEWLGHQMPAVRERATSADLIVSYYLQARRKSAAQMEAPVSQETFKSDLKHLAEDLKQFEDPSPPQQAPPSRSHSSEYSMHQGHGQGSNYGNSHAVSHTANHAPQYPPQVMQHHQQVLQNTPVQTPPQVHHQQPVSHRPLAQQATQPAQQATQPAQPVAQPTPSNQSATHTWTWSVDAKSLAKARELAQRFNLSSDDEGLRMLVALGAERATEILP